MNLFEKEVSLTSFLRDARRFSVKEWFAAIVVALSWVIMIAQSFFAR